MADVWDQQEGEPDPAYRRFLLYRDLGPERSIDAASHASRGHQKAPKGTGRASGAWKAESVARDWVRRAQAWDLHVISQRSQVAVLDFLAGVGIYSNLTLRALRTTKPPRGWDKVTHALQTLSKLIHPAAVAAMLDHARDPRPPANGQPGGSPALPQ